jgi:hypothetical protein
MRCEGNGAHDQQQGMCSFACFSLRALEADRCNNTYQSLDCGEPLAAAAVSRGTLDA